MRYFLLVSLALATSMGCSRVVEMASTRPAAKLARDLVEKLAAGDVRPLNDALLDRVKGPDTESKLRQMAALFPTTKPTAINLMHYEETHSAGGPASAVVTFEWQYPAHSLVATLALQDQGGGYRVTSANVKPSSAAQNALTWEGKGAAHKAMAVAGVLVVVVILVGLIQWGRTRGLRRRWVWLAVILVGVGKVAFNWTTGQVASTAVAVQLLGIGLTREGAAGPWTLALSIPLGALAFLLTRPGKKRPIATEAPSPDLPPP